MSEYRKAHADDLYFITLTVVGWIDVFSRKEYKCELQRRPATQKNNIHRK
jgi:hypothetical protein